MRKFLCVIDMQEDFVRGSLGSPAAEAIVPKVVEKIRNTPEDDYIIYTQDTHEKDYLEFGLEGQKLPVEHCIYDTDGWKLIPEVKAPFTEIGLEPMSILKNTFGSFTLAEYIDKAIDIEKVFEEDVEIELCGLCTDICVISNALILRAYFPNTKIIIDSSCCAGTSPEAHEAALTVMRSCQIDVI